MSELKTVETAASGVYDFESAFEAITQDRTDIARVLRKRVDELFEVAEQREDRVERHDVFTIIEETLTPQTPA